MARLQSTLAKLRLFGATPLRRKLLFVEAGLMLGLARVALWIVPFAKLAKGFGAFVQRDRPAERPPVGARADVAREISWAVVRASENTPFEAVCLPQAMAARWMLKRRGIASVMHFGAAKSETKPFDAHAWLDAEGVRVTGYPIAPGMVEIACFV